jgi:ribosome-associated protein
MQITPALTIDDAEIEERFVRASGPGGQNVNKVATAVQLRFDVAGSRSLPDDVKARLRANAGSRLTDKGVLVIDSREFRTQSRNREAARERLADLIRRSVVVPKRRRKTRPTKQARQERLTSKKRRGQVKAVRGKVRDEA